MCYHAVHHLGAVNVPANTRFVERELRQVSRLADPAAIVFAGEFAPMVEAVIDRDDPPALLEVPAEPRGPATVRRFTVR